MSSRTARLPPETGQPETADSRRAAEGPATRGSASAKTLMVNGERRPTRADTLDTLLIEAGYGGAKVATAVNGDFVAEKMRARTMLNDADHIEIVAPRQGG